MQLFRGCFTGLCAAVLVLGVSTTAKAIPTVIDFESYADGSFITAGTNVSGLTFNEDLAIYFQLSLFPGSSGNQAFRLNPIFDDFSGFFD